MFASTHSLYNIDVDLSYAALKKFRPNNFIQLQSNQDPTILYWFMNILIGFALYRFEMIKLYALFSLNWSEYTANCLICVIKKMDKKTTMRFALKSLCKFFFICIIYEFAVYAIENDFDKIHHIPHILLILFGRNCYGLTIKANGKSARWFHFVVIKCNWNLFI